MTPYIIESIPIKVQNQIEKKIRQLNSEILKFNKFNKSKTSIKKSNYIKKQVNRLKLTLNNINKKNSKLGKTLEKKFTKTVNKLKINNYINLNSFNFTKLQNNPNIPKNISFPSIPSIPNIPSIHKSKIGQNTESNNNLIKNLESFNSSNIYPNIDGKEFTLYGPIAAYQYKIKINGNYRQYLFLGDRHSSLECCKKLSQETIDFFKKIKKNIKKY